MTVFNSVGESMGNCILCRRPAAKNPFYIESVCLNIYSIEELCFFLKNNPALAYDVISSPSLAQWIFEECGIKSVVKEFAALPTDENNSSRRMFWIFEKSKFFTENELRVLRVDMEKLDSMDPVIRRRKKADALVKYGKYKRGIECYESLLKDENVKELKIRADIYYNMGAAFERLFQSGRALECFIKAYECESTEENLKACLNASYFDGGREALIAEAERLGANEGLVSQAIEEAQSSSVCDFADDPSSNADEWIRTYHMNVDN